MAAIEGLCQEVKEKQPTLVQMVEALKQASDETVGLLIKHFIMRDARQKDGEVKKVKLQMAVAPHSPKWGPHTNEELWQQLHQALLEIGGEVQVGSAPTKQLEKKVQKLLNRGSRR